MSYIRVVPRDLFNEANLLKCYGQLYLNLERLNVPGAALEHDGKAFDVQQDDNSGALWVANVALSIDGDAVSLHRPLNSREPWPLYLTTQDGTEVEVFSDTGSFTADLLALIGGSGH